MFYFNPQYLLYMAPAFLFMLAAQWYVKSTYRKWGKIPNHSGISGVEAAQRLIINTPGRRPWSTLGHPAAFGGCPLSGFQCLKNGLKSKEGLSQTSLFRDV